MNHLHDFGDEEISARMIDDPPVPLLFPTPYVQWRYPGETEWHDYHPHGIPWVDRLEVRLLPRPALTPSDGPVYHPPTTTDKGH